MSFANRKKVPLEKWIQDALTDPDKEGKCTQLTLMHLSTYSEREIHTTKFGGGKSWTPRDLADMFEGKADTFCQDLPGMQSFMLYAFYGGANEPSASHPFRRHNENTLGESGLMTEPPTDTGERQQNMRHKEMSNYSVYQRQSQLDAFAIKMIQMQSSMLEEVMRENRSSFAIVKELLLEKSLANHDHALKQIEAQRSADTQRKLLGLAPALLNTITGRDVVPQATADTALIDSLGEAMLDMTDEQLMGFAQTISVKPELQGIVLSRMQKAMEKARLAREENKEIQKAFEKINPEDDAAGNVNSGIVKHENPGE